jgi:hypothetical protein
LQREKRDPNNTRCIEISYFCKKKEREVLEKEGAT